MGWHGAAAVEALRSSSVFVLLTVLALAGTRRLSTTIVLFALQSGIIAALVFVFGSIEGSADAWAVGAMIVLGKVLLIPWALYRLTRRLQTGPDLPISLGPALSVLIAALIIAIAYSVIRPFAPAEPWLASILAAGIALILTGCFLMVSRAQALMQILGLLVLENGIFLAALATTFGMPLVIEMGIFFDLLIAVLLLGVFAFRIRDTFDHLDVSRLRRLRG